MATPTAFTAPIAPPAPRAAPRPAVSSASSLFVAPHRFAPRPIAAAAPRGGPAVPRMAFGLFSERATATTAGASSLFGFLRPKEVVAIPQHDTANAAKRAKAVEDGRATYQWRYDAIGDAAMTKDLPFPEELPAVGWLAQLAEVLVNGALNGLAEDVDEALEGSIVAGVLGAVSSVAGKVLTGQASPDDLFAAIRDVAKRYGSNAEGVGRTIQDYKDLFNTIKLDTVAKNDQFLRDDIFGWYRVAGPNPMKLTKLPANGVATLFPGLTDDVYAGVPGFAGDSLAAAARENRLYYIDYGELDGVPTGAIEGKTKDTFVYAPRCLLAVPPRDRTVRTPILPIAIRCGQDVNTYPLFTANAAHTDAVTWIAAKFTVQASDALVHEAVYHLGRCHLVEEAMMVSMHRTLPPAHPLHRLLKPSFYGTALINAAAVSTLISDGGIIDRITAPDIGTTRAIAGRAVADPSFRFNDWMPDVELAARGVTDAAALDFPYRDDALRHWAALNTFVGEYIAAFYASDAEVAGDHELQSFCEEVTKHGRIHDFGDAPGGRIATRAYLTRAIAMVLFTASVQHAAVNYPQSTLMQFTPAMPLAGAAPPPTTPRPYKTLDEWVNAMVPVLPQAETQLQTAETIGVLRYGMIGEYGKALDFAPEAVGEALEAFQEELGEMGAAMTERNKKQRLAGLPVYNYLVPKNVPLSINI